MPQDLLLRNALIVDGTGGSPWWGDVAVAGGRVSAMGEGLPPTDGVTCDLEGLALAPGFVDLHSHADFALSAFPDAASAIRQGVTTLVVGNCGFSPFPLSEEHGDALRSYCAFIDRGLSWQWTDAAGYRASLERVPMACNVVLQVGHGAVRAAIIGFDLRPAAPSEIEEMRRLVANAFAQGCAALSTGLLYAPGSAASTDEVVSLASVAAAAGGHYATHIRDEGDLLIAAVEEALEIGERAGIAVHLSHHKAIGRPNWGKVRESLARVDEARDRGLDVTADVYPYTASGTTLTASLPSWVMDGGVAAMRARLADPAVRARVRALLDLASSPDGSPGLRRFDPDTIVVNAIPPGPNKQLEGMTLAQIARHRGVDAVDAILDFVVEEGAGVAVLHFAIDESDMRTVLRHPMVAVASDSAVMNPEVAGPTHPRTYGTFARVLGRYVRDEHVLSLEEAVRKMTALPAGRARLRDRGTVRPGSVADLVVFDPDSITDRSTYALPHQFAEGVKHVLVGGEFAVRDGVATRVRAGQVLSDVHQVVAHGPRH